MEIPSLEKLKKYTTIEVLGTSEEKLQKNLYYLLTFSKEYDILNMV